MPQYLNSHISTEYPESQFTEIIPVYLGNITLFKTKTSGKWQWGPTEIVQIIVHHL
jgi:hypothetical protein